MKPEELMIGDWVTSKKWIDNPFRLTRINDNGKFHYGITINNSQVGPFFIDELCPISIAPEILEKNGFIQNNSSLWVLWKGDTDKHGEPINGYEVTVWKNGDCSIQSWDCDIGINITCKTVSELQHAMRICGISKEIEL